MLSKCSAIILAAIVIASYAKTPDQLKADFAGIMPTGKKARCAWQQGGTWTNMGAASMDLYGVDSDDGVIRKINSTTISATNPHVTADGSRVIFGDKNSGRIYIIDWNGSNQRVVKTSGTCLGYWRNPADKSDWVITGGDNNSTPFTRVNVDATTTSVVLWNGGSACGSPLVGISSDGTRLSAYFEKSAGWDPGVVTVPGGSPVHSVKKGGCGMGMAPDNSYDYFVHWSRLANGHHGIQFYNGTAAKDTFTLDAGILKWATTNSMENTCHDNDEFQNAKMTNDRNYVTFPMFNTKANPFIVRLSDRKFISIDDQLGCTYAAGLDVCFMSSTVVKNPRSVMPVTRTAVGMTASSAYGINGRRLASRLPGQRGIVVGQSTGSPHLQLRCE